MAKPNFSESRITGSGSLKRGVGSEPAPLLVSKWPDWVRQHRREQVHAPGGGGALLARIEINRG